MLQRGQLGANFGEVIKVNLRRDHAWTVRQFGENSSPGIDNHRVAVAFETLGAFAELIGGDNKHLVFDGAGSERKISQCAAPVKAVNAEGTKISCAPRSARPR